MSKTKQQPKVRIGKKEKTAILNYGLIKEQIRTLTKQKDLLKDEILPYFEKTNAIMLTGLDKYEGFAQRINRKSMRFDTATFKEQQPKLYANYLKASESTEIKVSLKSTEQKQDDEVKEQIVDAVMDRLVKENK